ncbi:hypothetical protein [Ponticoccus sp. (in: a-proteobacteria)]|uniref:hypothetical protein n=1 Tax=Ponticoccus sp. (in: a-proteobacteria) TaxID=1925025 RepID=UPI003AB1CB9A
MMQAYRMDYAEILQSGPTIGRRCGQPLSADGREMVSVRILLDWAFGTEKAQLDRDEIGASSGGQGGGRGAEAAIAEQLALGKRYGEGVRVDRSFGSTGPHHDAEQVATVLRNAVPWRLAVQVAELARAGRTPQWDLGPQRFVPRNWGRTNRFGRLGKSEALDIIEYRSARRGRVRREVRWTPVCIVPSAREVGAARRAWLDWWGALLAVQAGLRGVDLDLFGVTDAMPPLEPWKKGLD